MKKAGQDALALIVEEYKVRLGLHSLLLFSHNDHIIVYMDSCNAGLILQELCSVSILKIRETCFTDVKEAIRVETEQMSESLKQQVNSNQLILN